MDTRGEFRGSLLMKQKKKGKNLFRNLHRRRKNFYDVIVKQNFKKRPADHYSWTCSV